ALPWITGRIIDEVFRAETLKNWGARRDSLYALLLLLISSFVVLALSIYCRGLAAEWFSQKTIHRLRMALFVHMQKLDMGFYHHNTVGELMSRVTSDVEQVRNYCANGLMSIAFNVIFFHFAVFYMFYLNWQLTLLCLLISPVIALLALRFSQIGKRNQRYNRKAYAKLSGVAQESLNGIRVIQNFMSQDHEIDRFTLRNRKLTQGRQRSLANWAKYMPILEVLGSFSNILALTVGGYMAIRGDFSLGTWVQFTSYTWMIVMPMRQLGDLINTVNFARVSAERLFAILDEELHIRSPEGGGYVPEQVLPRGLHSVAQLPGGRAEEGYAQGRGGLEFAGVTWFGGQKEQAEAVLQDINLKVPAGSSLGIIGETGSGKTTLANLICRFADPDCGRILMDGVDLRQWNLFVLRAQIAYVMQEPFLFSETLAFNISFNEASISQDKVIRSAQRSAAHGFIGMLQQGYQTVVGERGVGLSGGQRQRTALARALVKEAPILILDDTTSAVDMETEREIQEQLRAINSHHTRLIIAHRISSVMACDQIIVMKDGQISERGSHQELMSWGGYYSQVFNEQQMQEE
ncbi:MAG: ABC transporter ATP-binding protein, partial [Spirochaetota bacterium]